MIWDSPGRVPLWLKVGWTAWVAVWAPAYAIHYGPQNFLWFCDIANFAIAAALWLENPLLLSWQAVSVLVAQVAWVVDLGARLVAGVHVFAATEYMFDAAIPLWLRLLSLFHVAQPLVLVWALARFGYDGRALPAQAACTWAVLPASYLFPAENINWVYRPFGLAQTAMAPGLYLAVCMIAYPLLLHLPTHLILRRFFRAAH